MLECPYENCKFNHTYSNSDIWQLRTLEWPENTNFKIYNNGVVIKCRKCKRKMKIIAISKKHEELYFAFVWNKIDEKIIKQLQLKIKLNLIIKNRGLN